MNDERVIRDCWIKPPEGWGDMAEIYVKYKDGIDEWGYLHGYFDDEISFKPEEFIGLTKKQAMQLIEEKDLAYLRS